MKKKSIGLIIGLMSIALLGVMAMQLYFLRESYQLKTQLFNQAVNESLSNLVAKIEKQDAFNFLDSKEKEQRGRALRRIIPQIVKIKNKAASLPLKEEGPALENSPEDTDEPAAAFIKQPAFSYNQVNAAILNRVRNGYRNDTSRMMIEQLPGKPIRMRLSAAGAQALNSYYSAGARSKYSHEINRERYARLLEDEQHKADQIFEKRDSAFRKNNSVAFAYKDVIPDPYEAPAVDLQMDVLNYEDAAGRLQQYAKLHVVPKAIVIGKNESTKKPARKDTIVSYVVIDPNEGAKVYTRLKPRMVQVSPQILEEDHAKQIKEATRVNKFVKKIENKNALQALVTEFQRVDMPLTDRIKFSLLDSLLKAELKAHGIDIPFEYKISLSKKDSVIFTKASNKQAFVSENTYQAKLFPKDIIRDAGLLSITFPGKNSVIFSNMSVMMGSSAGLLMVLLFCFGYTIHIILRQKKISEMKTDFINNMTHEFKTPVATIMIASEALKDPEVTEDHSRIKRLAGIIYDENVRLGNHIERVLNIAKIDKDDLKLEDNPVDMNELVAAITDSMALQLQKKEATVNLDLKANRAIVHGDELHLSNVIFNLIDNAIKYSKGQPEVSIATYNAGKHIIIKVADNGIGMGRDQLAKIFEQFYRIPTGNLHDVKGFGLGLSYVNNIIKRLGGTVKVKSEKDKGSEFEITLPAHIS